MKPPSALWRGRRLDCVFCLHVCEGGGGVFSFTSQPSPSGGDNGDTSKHNYELCFVRGAEEEEAA